jgi:8-oxo-dGTP pyrophosphatase MutT (NUDIX family)
MDVARINPGSLRRALAAPPRRSSDFDLDAKAPPKRLLRPASVLVALVEHGGGLGVVLTRRNARLKHHPGQIGFPGGKQDAGDPTPLAAALREAHEEIGLAPDRVEILGSFDGHDTVTDFAVTPFVGLVRGPFTPVIDRSEVEEAFEAPLAYLLDPANMRRHGRRWGGRWREYYAVPYGPYYIWGATARMLKSLSDRMGPP